MVKNVFGWTLLFVGVGTIIITHALILATHYPPMSANTHAITNIFAGVASFVGAMMLKK